MFNDVLNILNDYFTWLLYRYTENTFVHSYNFNANFFWLYLQWVLYNCLFIQLSPSPSPFPQPIFSSLLFSLTSELFLTYHKSKKYVYNAKSISESSSKTLTPHMPCLLSPPFPLIKQIDRCSTVTDCHLSNCYIIHIKTMHGVIKEVHSWTCCSI